MAVSADTPEETVNLCSKAGLTFPVMSDRDLNAIRGYDLLIAEKADDGHEVGGPGEFLIDPSGTIRWRKLTEVRPPEILAAAKVLQ